VTDRLWPLLADRRPIVRNFGARESKGRCATRCSRSLPSAFGKA